MAPTLRSAPKSSTPHKRSKPAQGRVTRAKSLATGLDSITDKATPKLAPFKLGLIKPTNVAICKACKTPIIKSPSPPVTPKFNKPARSRLEGLLQSALIQAHARTVNIQAAYASASKDYNALGNHEVSTERDELDLDAIPEEWRHAPYTADACKIIGTLYGELGRALATSQKAVAMLQSCLEGEREMLESEKELGPEATRIVRRGFEDAFFTMEKAKRVEQAQPKKRKRTRR